MRPVADDLTCVRLLQMGGNYTSASSRTKRVLTRCLKVNDGIVAQWFGAGRPRRSSYKTVARLDELDIQQPELFRLLKNVFYKMKYVELGAMIVPQAVLRKWVVLQSTIVQSDYLQRIALEQEGDARITTHCSD